MVPWEPNPKEMCHAPNGYTQVAPPPQSLALGIPQEHPGCQSNTYVPRCYRDWDQ